MNRLANGKNDQIDLENMDRHNMTKLALTVIADKLGEFEEA